MSLRIAPVLRTVAARRLPMTSAPALRRAYAVAPSEGAAGGAPPPPPPPPPKSGGNGLLIGVLALLGAGGGAYWYFNEERPKEYLQAVKDHSQADYQKVYDAIAAGLEKEGYDDGSLAPVVLRLAWHASGTYDDKDKTGGSNYATMRFQNEANHGANAGLNVARDYMEGIKKQFPWISYGDLWTLGGVAAVQETGGPAIPWRPGRVDGLEINQTPDGRLPDASQGQDHLRNIFNRMGFNDQEIVALAGAHALGRCHTDRSGYDGPWTFSPVTFSNQFYDLLLNDKWTWRKWKGPAQFQDKSTTLMMLPTDMALVKDKSFRKYVEEYAKDEDKFFKDFSKACSTLFELGVPKDQFKNEPWTMKST